MVDKSGMEYFARHPTLDMLEFYLLNQLHHQDQQTLAAHLDSCSACQTMAEKLLEQIEIIRETLVAA